MKTGPSLPNRLRFMDSCLPVIQVKRQPDGRLRRVHTRGEHEYLTDPSGRYAYDLAESFAHLYQWHIGADGLLSPLSPHKVDAHSHPNTLQFHPSKRFAYVTCSHGAICQYQIHSGILIPMDPLAVYTRNDPSSLWFDRNGNFACVIIRGGKEQYPPENRVYIYSVGQDGRLNSALEIGAHGSNITIAGAAWAGCISSFTVTGDRLDW